MVTVAELVPGDLVTLPPDSAVFIVRAVHPVWPSLMLVIWRLGDGWSLDALSAHQEVGDVTPSSHAERQGRLRAALLEGQRS
jgi:hypothetical protein